MRLAILSLMALVLALGQSSAGDNKSIWTKKDQISKEDDRDTVTKGYRKVYNYPLEEGKSYRIDLESADFDAFLRVEDPTGKEIAKDNDGGEGFNSRTAFQITKSGDYRIIAISFPTQDNPKGFGKFTLTISPASAQEIFIARLTRIAEVKVEERKALVSELITQFEKKKSKIGIPEARLAFQVTQQLEEIDIAEAANAYSEFGKLLSTSDEVQVAKASVMFLGTGRRLGSMGKEIDIKGTTADGKEIDIAQLKGKVVLVDFWATWCGPCRDEIPNIKKMYEKYHDKGFEVIGVSIDRSKPALEKFLEAEKLPWSSIYDPNAPEAKRLSVLYGVNAIPQAILVDQQGRVISLHARGDELVQHLDELLGKESKK